MRYARQSGLVDKKNLSKATALAAGLGGLGCPAATYLALAGVNIVLVDNDLVEESNLNHQFLYTEKDIDKPKVEVAARRLRELNPHIRVEAGSFSDVKNIDVVLDCLDNWSSRRGLCEKAFKHRKPAVHGMAGEWYGQVAVFRSMEEEHFFEGKREKGYRVVGATAGLIGPRMALEAIKLLTGSVRPKLATFSGEFEEFPLQQEEWTHVLVWYAEVWIKSDVTKRRMLGVLAKNIREATGHTPQIKSHCLILPYARPEKLSRVFGISSFSPALFVPLSLPFLNIRTDDLSEDFFEPADLLP